MKHIAAFTILRLVTSNFACWMNLRNLTLLISQFYPKTLRAWGVVKWSASEAVSQTFRECCSGCCKSIWSRGAVRLNPAERANNFGRALTRFVPPVFVFLSFILSLLSLQWHPTSSTQHLPAQNQRKNYGGWQASLNSENPCRKTRSRENREKLVRYPAGTN